MNPEKQNPEQLLNRITVLGSYEYPVEKMIAVLQLDETDAEHFKQQMNDPDSDYYRAYIHGKNLADYAIDTALFNKAKAGDLLAIQLYEKRRSEYRENTENAKLVSE